MSKGTTTEELRVLELKSLHELLSEKRERLRQLRFDLVSGKVKNLREIKALKKDIARVMTIINEKQKK